MAKWAQINSLLKNASLIVSFGVFYLHYGRFLTFDFCCLILSAGLLPWPRLPGTTDGLMGLFDEIKVKSEILKTPLPETDGQ